MFRNRIDYVETKNHVYLCELKRKHVVYGALRSECFPDMWSHGDPYGGHFLPFQDPAVDTWIEPGDSCEIYRATSHDSMH